MKRDNVLKLVITLSVIIGVTGLVLAVSQDDLQVELDNLIQELNNNDYSWLVNYSGEVLDVGVGIEVYEKDGENIVAVFENVSSEGFYQVYLSSLDGVQDVFDLKVVCGGEGGGNSSGGNESGGGWGFNWSCGVEFDYIVDPVITIIEENVVSDSFLVNVTSEIGDSNFTHLNISTEAPYDSLVGYWNFDGDVEDTQGVTAYDWSGRGNDGNYSGDANVTSGGLYEDYAQFDGGLDFVEVGNDNSLDLSENITISVWVNATGSGQQAIVGKDGNSYILYLRHSAGADVAFWVVDSSDRRHSLATGTLTYGIWQHIAGTFDGNNLTVYINGSVVGSTTSDSARTRSFTSIRIGYDTLIGSPKYFNGLMDEVMIFNTSLSAAQILAIYENQSSRFVQTGTQKVRAVNISQNGSINKFNVSTTFDSNLGSNVSARVGQINSSVNLSGLVLYMPFEWGSAVDISGAGNDGTLVGAAWNETGGLNDTGGFEFDGSGDYIDVGGVSGINETTGTYSAWVKVDEDPPNANQDVIFNGEVSSNKNEIKFAINDNLAVQFFYRLNTTSGYTVTLVSDNSDVTVGEWINIVGTWKGNDEVRLYLNGVLETNETITFGMSALPTTFYIGRDDDDNHFVNGSIDEVMIWDRSLSATEILDLYLNQSSKYNVIYYTPYQTLTSDVNTTFNISTAADFVFPFYEFSAGNSTNTFYSPVITGNIELDLFEFVVDTFGIAVDNATSTSGTATTLSWSHTINEGENRLLVVGTGDHGVTAVNSVTYDGVSMTLGKSQDSLSGTSTMWYLVAPNTGDNTVLVTFASDSDDNSGGAISFTGVDQGIPLGTFASAAASTVDVTSATGELVVDIVGNSAADAGTWTAGAGQTKQWDETGAEGRSSAMSTEEGASTVTMSWNTGTQIVGVSIKPLSESDPVGIEFVDPTPANGSTQTVGNIEINISINESNLDEVIFNWNGTNYTIFNDSLVFMTNLNNVSDIGENSSLVVDISGRGINGTVTNAVLNTTNCPYGNCYTFDGDNDYIDFGTPFNFTNTTEFSVSAWFYLAGTNLDNAEFAVGRGANPWWHLGIKINSDEWRFYIYDGTNILLSVYSDTDPTNKWVHLVGTYDGNKNITFYFNGVNIDSDTVATLNDFTDADKNFLIGGVAGKQWNGQIDEIIIWNRTLSADEIQQLYFTNLHKYDEDNWALYVNRSLNSTDGLEDGDYTFYATALDDAGNFNATEERTVTIGDVVELGINFTMPPTPANGSSQTAGNIEINISINESNLDEVIFNWNGTNYTVFNDSVVLFMNFDNVSELGENDTLFKDLSQFGNNGTGINFNIDEIVTGLYGNAVDLEGSNDAIEIAHSDNLVMPFGVTLSAWVKPDSFSGTPMILGYNSDGNGNDLLFGFDTTGRMCIWAGGQNDCDTNILATNDWIFLTWVFDDPNNNVSYYVNASFSAEDSATATPTYSNGQWYIGAECDSPPCPDGNYFNGLIDNLILYNRTLNEDEIEQLYFTNLYKYDEDNWALYVNRSLNSTDGLEDGDYTFYATALDDAGNFNATEERTVSIDNDFPNVAINDPTTQNYSSTSILFNVTAVDGILIDSCWVTVDGGVSNLSLVKDGITDYYNATNTSVSDGSYTAQFYCNDTINNINDSESVAFDVDATAPVVNTPSLIPSQPWLSDDLNCSFTITENIADPVTANVTWYNNNVSQFTFELSVTEGIVQENILESENLSIGEFWMCEVLPYDGVNAGTAKNSSEIEVNDFNVAGIEFVGPTPANGTSQTAGNIEINISINESNLNEVIFNWNGTNYTVFNDSVVLFMNFDNVSELGENDTHVVDLSGNGNNGTVTGAVVNTTDCRYGNCFTYDGSNDYIDVANEANFDFADTQFTVTGWFKTTTGSGAREMIVTKSLSSDFQWGIEKNANDQLLGGYFKANGGDVFLKNSAGTINDGIWHHFAVVMDTNTSTEDVLLYLDGNEETTVDADNRGINDYNTGGAGRVIIGARKHTSTQLFFNGTIDEVRIFDRNLSSDEIEQLYFTNFHKYDEDNWALYVNRSLNSTDGLPDGDYTFYASAKDDAGNFNATEERTVTVAVAGKNAWVCTSISNFTNASCWSLGRAPIAGDDLYFNSSGDGDITIQNNTMPQDLNSFTVESTYTSNIYFYPLFAVGDWTGNNDGTVMWNVSNNINISGTGSMFVYGDYLHVDFTNVSGNITGEGHGAEWQSINGNISIGADAVLDGDGLGFPQLTGPGNSGANKGAAHGGYGGRSSTLPYGNASAPTSLGSGGEVNSDGGSAIKLQAESGTISVDGTVNMRGTTETANRGTASGGSVWLIANNISGSGAVRADARYVNPQEGGAGGRIRFDFNTLSYDGIISVDRALGDGNSKAGRYGTFSFSSSLTEQNYTWPSDWTINGSIGLPGGNYTVLGNLVVLNGSVLAIHAVNDTAVDNGHGVIINVTGNITIESGAIIDGVREGFLGTFGPGGAGTSDGGTHGGKGYGNTDAVYGSEINPISLGSGGEAVLQNGGGAIELETTGTITIDGDINMSAIDIPGGEGASGGMGAGGSVLLVANIINGIGTISADGGYSNREGGGGGRIALHATTINFTGVVNNIGGDDRDGGQDGSGGTVYINASTSITMSGNITTVGLEGGNITFVDTTLILSGFYNATNSSGGTDNAGTIELNYTDCSNTDISSATFNPAETVVGDCKTGTNVTINSPLNQNYSTASILFNATVLDDILVDSCWVTIDGGVSNLTLTNDTFIDDYSVTNSSVVDGDYTANFYCNDSSNNINDTESVSFGVDTIFPTLTVEAPVNNSKFNVSSVDFNVSGSETLDWCGLSIDGGANVTMGGFNTTFFNVTNTSMVEGSHSFIFTCNDSANNYVSSGSQDLFIDTVNSDLSYVGSSPRDGGAINDSSVNLNVSISDVTSAITYGFFDEGLVGWWTMDDINSSGDVVDISGEGNDGAAFGDASQTDAGYFGKGFSFDGDDDFIDIGTPPNVGGDFSISIWAYATGDGAYNGNDGYMIGQKTDPGNFFFRRQGLATNLIEIGIGDTSVANFAAPVEIWQHYVVVHFANGTYSLFIDGVDGGGQVSSDFTGFTDDLYLGNREDLARDFDGSIDDVMIFNRSLSADEILSLYNSSDHNIQRNLSGLSEGSQSYTAHVVDEGGNRNSSVLSFDVDLTYSDVDFVSPTPANASIQSNTDIYVNVSASDSVNNISVFIDDGSLVGWWRMDDINSSGDVIDYTGVNNGTVVGDAHQVGAGYMGKGFSFDGSGDYVNVTSSASLNISEAITLAAWVKPDYLCKAGYDRIVTKSHTAPSPPFTMYGLIVICDTDTPPYEKEHVWFEMTNNGTQYMVFTDSKLEVGTWSFLTATFNGSKMSIYFNGVEENTTLLKEGVIFGGSLPVNTISTNDWPVTIGSDGHGGNYFNGTIDDVMIFNRSLSAEEILGLYANTSIKYVSNNFTSLSDGDYSYTAYVQDEAGNVNVSEVRTVTILVNTAPDNSVVSINSSDDSNKTAVDLKCFTTISDPDSGDLFNVTVEWYNNSVFDQRIDINDSVANGTLFIATLDNANITKTDVWSCGMIISDGDAVSSFVNSSDSVTIINTAPTVTLDAPANDNVTDDRTPEFNWTGSDDDGDALSYEVNVSLVAASTCTDTERYEDNNTVGGDQNFTPSTYLKCLDDNNDYYQWSVVANDGEGDGAWTSYRNISISSVIIISLPTSIVNFSAMNVSDFDDTSDNSPAPLVLSNDGNVEINITANFTTLWNSEPSPNASFQFKIRNLTDNCFVAENTVLSYINAPIITGFAINRLNFTNGYQTGCNNASIDLNVTVPPFETSGEKSSTVTFTSSLAEK